MALGILTRTAKEYPARMQSDEHLLARVGAGDRDAYARLVALVAPQAMALAVRVTRNRDLAEEATQEAFVDVWLKAERFDIRRGGVRQWILTLVHHKSVDAVRRERTASRMAEGAPEPAPAVDPEVAGVESDRRSRVMSAVSNLPHAQREAITLAYFGGLSYREVAERLQIPEGTAKSRLRDGLRNLRGHLETAGIDLPDSGRQP